MPDDAPIGEDLKVKFRRLMKDRDSRDELKEALKEAEKEYRETEGEVWMALDESPIVGDVKVDIGDPWGVVRFGTRETYYGRILDKELAQEHFENRAMVEEVSEVKFSMARINEIVRDYIDEGKQLPPGIDFYARRPVAISQTKKD